MEVSACALTHRVQRDRGAGTPNGRDVGGGHHCSSLKLLGK
jgi:hypothetical protein